MKKNTFLLIIIGVLSLLCVIFAIRGNNMKIKYQNSLAQSRDTVFYYKNKVGELYSANTAYITDLSTLKDENENLYKELKNIKDNPLVVTKIKTEYVIDSVVLETPVYIDTVNDSYKSDFLFNDDYTRLSCTYNMNIRTMSAEMLINELKVKCDYSIDFVDGKDGLCVLAKSDNPNIQINNIEGYLISPEQSKILKKRFNKPWGLMAGVGCTATVIDNSVRLVPGIHITLGYKFINF